MHIGLIGGIGPAATEFYYRGLVKAHALAEMTMQLTIVHAEARDLVRNFNNRAAQTQAEIFLALVQRLQAAGADVAAVTSLGGHFCIKELEAISPLPILNAIPVLDAYFAQQTLKRIGLLGTRTVMATGFYGGVTSIETVAPQGDDLEATHDHYVTMALSGHATEEQRDFMFSAGKKLCREQGADAVVLAGTDLFLAFDGYDCGFPVIDAGQVHIDALAAASMGKH